VRFDRWVKKVYPRVSFGEFQKWIRTGQVRVNKKRIKTSYTLQKGDAVRFPPQFAEVEMTFSKDSRPIGNRKTRALLQQNIVYEDALCVVINKPQGLSVHGGTGLTDYIDLYLDHLLEGQLEPLRITHRLDKDTSGLLILAKTQDSARYYTGAFQKRKIMKVYHAVIVGRPDRHAGEIDLPIGKMRGIEREKVSSKAEDLDEALTEYRELVYDHDRNITLVQLCPHTGRTHQLRVHMLEGLGCPILGDGKYGGKEAHPLDEETTMHLAATSLEFTSETGAPVRLTLPLPDFFVNVGR
jgi:23S rRNA pseudouridine955/2504/2580 synthase